MLTGSNVGRAAVSQDSNVNNRGVENHKYITTRDRSLRGRAIAQAVSRRFPPPPPRGVPGSSPGNMEFVVDKVVLGQVFSEYYDFPLSILISLIAPHSSSSGADVPSALTSVSSRPKKKKLGHSGTTGQVKQQRA
jgi:hypothetical protein